VIDSIACDAIKDHDSASIPVMTTSAVLSGARPTAA
jgi:hypothetical protein